MINYDPDDEVPIGVKIVLGLMVLFGIGMMIWGFFGGCG